MSLDIEKRGKRKGEERKTEKSVGGKREERQKKRGVKKQKNIKTSNSP